MPKTRALFEGTDFKMAKTVVALEFDRIAEVLKNEHEAGVGHGVPCTVRPSSDPRRFFVYWNDGQIERRDTYVVDGSEASLETMAQRYTGYRAWSVLE